MCVKRMKLHPVAHAFAEEVQQRLQQCGKFFRGIDVHGGRAAQHAECGKQADEAKTMVAVEMGNKDMVQAGKLQARTSKLKLSTFAAINHEQLFAYVHHLRTWVMLHRGQSRTTA